MKLDLPKMQVPMEQLVRGLGYFSIGLGLAELLAPRPGQPRSGHAPAGRSLKGVGLREIATGIGILTASNPGPGGGVVSPGTSWT